MEKLRIVAQKSVGCTMYLTRDSATRVNDAGMDAGSISSHPGGRHEGLICSLQPATGLHDVSSGLGFPGQGSSS